MKKKRISDVWIIVGVVVALAVIAWLLSGSKKEETVNFTTETRTGQYRELGDRHR